MKTFKESSWFIKYWVYLHTQVGMGYIPSRTNLCTMFWKTVLITPLFIIVVIAIGPIILVAAGAILCLVKFTTWFGDHIPKTKLGSRIEEAIQDGFEVTVEYFVSRKKKYCPLIDITED